MIAAPASRRGRCAIVRRIPPGASSAPGDGGGLVIGSGSLRSGACLARRGAEGQAGAVKRGRPISRSERSGQTPCRRSCTAWESWDRPGMSARDRARFRTANSIDIFAKCVTLSTMPAPESRSTTQSKPQEEGAMARPPKARRASLAEREDTGASGAEVSGGGRPSSGASSPLLSDGKGDAHRRPAPSEKKHLRNAGGVPGAAVGFRGDAPSDP